MQLGLQEAADLLDETLAEEKKTDELLTEIAGRINAEAVEAEGDEDEVEPAPAKKRKGTK
jgi:ferritin-like metal-binding protein YciE